ncbi:hypothetical protein [Streptomyces albipurpureus]|uniref:DUF4913 domain-containing protein n=1 Tax=Streptomyces albipurpureus TaxID=2897419 RepID=A0ABT0UJZ5_9ACTN|nr:hypothetical protein [Streptomyces sp. CWNU-1]MCM2388770.1 hypothetical protein [Streptomyces sp. CWNU-1]
MTSGGFDDLFAALQSVNQEVVTLNAELVLLGERVKILEEGRASSVPFTAGAEGVPERIPGMPVDWDTLDSHEMKLLWPPFVSWVIWLADRYEVTNDQLPRHCWWLHGGVVEELTALWTSRQSAYAAGEDAGSAPYLWQDALARGIERIGRLWLGTCRTGQHRERHRETWADVPYRNAILASEATAYDGRADGNEPSDGTTGDGGATSPRDTEDHPKPPDTDRTQGEDRWP